VECACIHSLCGPWGAQIEVFEVTHHAFGAQGGDYTIKENIGCQKVSSLGADIVANLHNYYPYSTACNGVFLVWGNRHTSQM